MLGVLARCLMEIEAMLSGEKHPLPDLDNASEGKQSVIATQSFITLDLPHPTFLRCFRVLR
jgi:hypothetical protein